MNPLDSANVATNLKDLAYDSRDHETTIMSARAPVRYPWWVHLMAASIFGAADVFWRPNGKIFVCSVLRNESVRWSCISPRR